MMYVRYPLSLRNVEDPLFERGIDFCHETVRLWWDRFGPMFASEVRRERVQHMRSYTHWRWRLDEVFVRINGKQKYRWRAVDHEGEVLESYVTEARDKAAALKFIKKAVRRQGRTKVIVTDRLRSYGAALKEIGAGRTPTNRPPAQQSGREQPPPLPTTRTGHAAISADEDLPEIRFGPRLRPQPFQPGASPRLSPNLQTETRPRAGRVADSHGLNAGRVWVNCITPETSARWADSAQPTSASELLRAALSRGRPHCPA
jgi:hypothetical protein